MTLHVGLGTFRPVTAERVSDHRMHSEWYRFSDETARVVNEAVATGRRIVCVGTTSVRALEGALAAGEGQVEPGEGWTDIFITPGFEFRGVGAMLTNFHLPKSTLLMLVSAFAGRDRVLERLPGGDCLELPVLLLRRRDVDPLSRRKYRWEPTRFRPPSRHGGGGCFREWDLVGKVERNGRRRLV